MSHGRVAQATRLQKERLPGLYCPDPRCLWMTGGGRCPRHGGPAWSKERNAEAHRKLYEAHDAARAAAEAKESGS